LRKTADGYALTLTATKLARAVWIDVGETDAKLSDNAFDLLPGESRTLHIESAADLATLGKSLAVRSLYGATTAGVR
jgi:beta-mannosidase